MTLAPSPLQGLPAFDAADVEHWNWFQRVFPGVDDWQIWLAAALGELIPEPAGEALIVEQTDALASNQNIHRFRFEKHEITLGREADNDIVLPAPAITKRHARILMRDDGWLLEDLGGSLGTIVGGKKLAPLELRPLRNGAQFTIFPYDFTVRLERVWRTGRDVRLSAPRVESGAWGAFRVNPRSGFALHVEPLGLAAYIEIHDVLFSTAIRHALRLVQIDPAGPAPVDDDVCFFLLLACLEAAGRDVAFPYQFSLGPRGAVPEFDPKTRGIAIEFSVGLGDGHGPLRIFLPYRLLEAMKKTHSGAKPALPGGLTFPYLYTAGSVDLTPEETASLESGDILFHSLQPAFLNSHRMDLGWEVSAVETDAGGINLKIERPLKAKVPMNAGLEGLTLRIDVILAERELTLEEAEDLAPGALLPLERNASAPVQLAINGRVIGEGELVDIEGRLGVRILSWRCA